MTIPESTWRVLTFILVVALVVLLSGGRVKWDAKSNFVGVEIPMLQKDKVHESRIWAEHNLKTKGKWVEVAKLYCHSLVKLYGYSSENNHYQPFEIYAMRPYCDYSPNVAAASISEIHVHSADIEWTISQEGTVKVRKARFDTPRELVINTPIVLKGDIKKLKEK